MTAGRLALVVPFALAADAFAARMLALHVPAAAAAGFAAPLPVVTNWNAFGALLLSALVLATIAAGWSYLRLLALLREGADVSLAFVLGVSAIAMACGWFSPVLFSSDVYAYAAYGEMLRAGLDPYAHGALPIGNPVFAAAVWQWGNPPPVCVYGPAFVAIAASTLTALAPLGTLAQLDGLRALACLALLACGAAAYAAYPGERRERVLASATIALNPVAVWCAIEGHNDALALAVVLCGFALVRRAPGAGGAIVALSTLFKAPGLAAAAALAVASKRARFGAIAGIAAAIALCYPLIHAATSDVAPGGHYLPQASLQAVFRVAPPLAIAAALAACALLARAGVRRLRRNDPSGWIYLAVAAWMLVPNPYPWYGLWLLAVAALAPGTRVATTALLLSLTSLLRYVPDAIAAPGEPLAAILGIAAILPLALLR